MVVAQGQGVQVSKVGLPPPMPQASVWPERTLSYLLHDSGQLEASSRQNLAAAP